MQGKEAFKGAEIEGMTGSYNVKLRISTAEQLEISLENRESFDTYFLRLRPEEIKKENIRNHCDYIQTPSELFQYLQFSLGEAVPFAEMVKVEAGGKVVIRLEVKIDLKSGSKRKMLVYEFQAAKQVTTLVDRLRNQVNSLSGKVEKEVVKRLEELEEENRRLRQLISEGQKGRGSESGQDLVKFATNRGKLVIRNDTILQTENKLNIVLLGSHLSGSSALEWKVRISDKMVLVFGIGSPELTALQNSALEQAISEEKLLTKEYLTGGEIITCVFEQGEMKYSIERVDIQQNEEDGAEVNYNLKRGSFMCKKLVKLDECYPCFGLRFGCRIEVLSVTQR